MCKPTIEQLAAAEWRYAAGQAASPKAAMLLEAARATEAGGIDPSVVGQTLSAYFDDLAADIDDRAVASMLVAQAIAMASDIERDATTEALRLLGIVRAAGFDAVVNETAPQWLLVLELVREMPA